MFKNLVKNQTNIKCIFIIIRFYFNNSRQSILNYKYYKLLHQYLKFFADKEH